MDIIALILVIIGGLNWGLVGIFQFDLVAFLFGGSASIISRIIYTLVGLGALLSITFFFLDEILSRFKAKKLDLYNKLYAVFLKKHGILYIT